MSSSKTKASQNVDQNDRRTHAENLLRQINDIGIEYVDFRFTDLQGIWHHLSVHKNAINEELLADGIAFDGSSLPGWAPIHNSDMILLPDSNNAVADQIPEHPTLIVFCTVFDPNTQQAYTRDPRTVAIKGEEYLSSLGFTNKALFGVEPEFFIFDEVHFETASQSSFYSINWSEGAYPNTGVINHKHGNLRHFGHHPMPGRGYFPVPPVDSANDLRSKMLTSLNTMGLKSEKHHHEVASGQHEIGFKYSTLLSTGDNLQLFKYIVRNIAHSQGKTVTFMPKPIYGDNGSGMHVHQSLWLDEEALFGGSSYAGLSDMALYYIGGILHHARSLCAFTNPTTNSYKRLVPGFEAPVYIAYSANNRSAAVRIPHVSNSKQRRIEIRFPDPSANSYLALTAIMMAGLDGIQNKIKPGEALDQNLYDVANAKHCSKVLCSCLQDSLRDLKEDHQYLLKGEVFTEDLIQAYIKVKEQEIHNFARAPHPVEFEMYYSI